MGDRLEVAQQAPVHAQMAVWELAEALTKASHRVMPRAGSSFAWVWILVAGVLVVGGAAGMAYCQQQGYARFTGDVRASRDANGVQVGVDIGCV